MFTSFERTFYSLVPSRMAWKMHKSRKHACCKHNIRYCSCMIKPICNQTSIGSSILHLSTSILFHQFFIDHKKCIYWFTTKHSEHFQIFSAYLFREINTYSSFCQISIPKKMTQIPQVIHFIHHHHFLYKMFNHCSNHQNIDINYHNKNITNDLPFHIQCRLTLTFVNSFFLKITVNLSILYSRYLFQPVEHFLQLVHIFFIALGDKSLRFLKINLFI